MDTKSSGGADRTWRLAQTLDEATDPVWLSNALAEVTGGAAIADVQIVEVLRTMATKVRFVAKWNGGEGAFCLKAFLDMGELAHRSGPTSVIECSYYSDVAQNLSVTAPNCVAALIDRPGNHGVLIMRDLIAEGGRFCSALEPLDADQAARSLDQLARLHAGASLLERMPWIGHRVSEFAEASIIDEATLQSMLDGPRSDGLTLDVRSSARLLSGLKALAAYDRGLPATLVHGDCHAGNLFRTGEGFGLIDWQLLQRGGWALDVAYHIAAVLPVEVAEKEERNLLAEYLERARGHGCETPGIDEAWEQYRRAAVWGYYLWAITRKVDPPIIKVFVNRLGNAVARHGSYGLLGV